MMGSSVAEDVQAVLDGIINNAVDESQGFSLFDETDDSLNDSSSSTNTVRNVNESLESITSIDSSFTDQATQTEEVCCDSMSAIPINIMKAIEKECPWLITAFRSIDCRFTTIESKMATNNQNYPWQ